MDWMWILISGLGCREVERVERRDSASTRRRVEVRLIKVIVIVLGSASWDGGRS